MEEWVWCENFTVRNWIHKKRTKIMMDEKGKGIFSESLERQENFVRFGFK